MVVRFTQNQINKEYDLIIIGGGINGCGIARDASERGLKVLLLEKEDFGSGCTSASSRLIHGGLRYLEHFEFDLVRESLYERELLLKNASHLITPLELCVPIYKKDKRGYFLIKAGMLLYDFLSFDKSLKSHKMFSKDEFLRHEPAVKQEDLVGGAVFYDCQAEYPERICLENILMAKQKGAVVLNHAKVLSINSSLNKIKNVEFLDVLSGKTFIVSGKVIVNASGPWVDELTKTLNIKRKTGCTKGSHIIIKKFKDGPTRGLYVSAKSDNRPFFILPWQNYYLIGTTDISFSGNLENVKISEPEINYLMSEVNNILKKTKISKTDILFTYSGVRPLPYCENLKPSDITRKHIVFDHGSEGIQNFISVIGGKLTTYRNLSEQVVNLVLKKLNHSSVPCKTRDIAFIRNIGSSLDEYFKLNSKKVQKKYGVDDDIFKHLIKLYGSQYKNVLDLTLKDAELGYLLDSYSLNIRAQVIYAIQNELAYTISDVLLRRTTLGLNEKLGHDSVLLVGGILKQFLNYSDDEIKSQIKNYEENVIKPRSLF